MICTRHATRWPAWGPLLDPCTSLFRAVLSFGFSFLHLRLFCSRPAGLWDASLVVHTYKPRERRWRFVRATTASSNVPLVHTGFSSSCSVSYLLTCLRDGYVLGAVIGATLQNGLEPGVNHHSTVVNLFRSRHQTSPRSPCILEINAVCPLPPAECPIEVEVLGSSSRRDLVRGCYLTVGGRPS